LGPNPTRKAPQKGEGKIEGGFQGRGEEDPSESFWGKKGEESMGEKKTLSSGGKRKSILLRAIGNLDEHQSDLDIRKKPKNMAPKRRDLGEKSMEWAIQEDSHGKRGS